MSIISTTRASYQHINPTIMSKQPTLTPTVTEEVKHFYTVSYGDKRRILSSIHEVNAILAVNSSVKVVKTTKTVTTRTSHKRIR